MKYEELSFTTTNEEGEELINDIISVVPNPNNSEEPYIMFTDYTLDKNDDFKNQYGKLIKEGDNYLVKTNLSNEEINYIKNAQEDEIIKHVNEAIEEALHE